MTRLTVLGSCGAWPEAERACNGFLLDHDGFRVVLDLGFATLPRLLAICPRGVVDAVIVTHEHPDHCVDLNALSRVRYFDRDRGSSRIPVWCTPGVVERVDFLEPTGGLDQIFDIRALAEGGTVGPFRMEAVRLPHHVPNWGVRLAADNVTVAYTGDTGPDPGLARLGRETDLFIVEASHPGPPKQADRQRLHLTAGEAGEWAERAGARTLMLTHFWPGSDRDLMVAEAAARFGGKIIAADEGLYVELP